jgi:predicted Rossmann fold nucleotide-binding protein DprA/Smf involved in DNA uptake
VARNALVVRLADVVAVLQADLPSGSLRTGRMAQAQSKPVIAVPDSPGCVRLIREGALALRSESDTRNLERIVRGALVAAASGRAFVGPATLWPEHLKPLEAALHGVPNGMRVGECQLAGSAAALLEAEDLGLVCERLPGLWVIAESL